ncbi:MotA/TolQ/ExbB proton channel family protein [Hydrogenobacter hydrogenophilus]|uniref:Biopolymer transport protein ExbB n=1 Tax=Hydrogenobacter hydrogenophilus TaxID=35835 RepID=A0A285NVN3_9AQUI|nr:MotA/TolQ/ExbB proton channel family protein [Hydrogenobacter hydrogenophilus]SNZ13525.1 biopolymer transport protein ExbB [Hydrogenobacter hydrogenophilus]
MDTLFSLLEKGGFAVYVLVFLSLVSWALIVERLFNLRFGSMLSKSVKDVRSLLASGDVEGALKLLSLDNSPASQILYRLLEEYKEGKADKRILMSDLSFEVSLLAPKVEKNLALLSTIASVSPLIGLFGTITGLIKVFSAFAVAQTEQGVALLATGISEALISAATGLAVAIPALLAYWIFRIMGNSILDRIEQELTETLRVLK